MPIIRIFTRTSPGFGTGAGTSLTRRTSGPPCFVRTSARMSAAPLCARVRDAEALPPGIALRCTAGLETRVRLDECLVRACFAAFQTAGEGEAGQRVFGHGSRDVVQHPVMNSSFAQPLGAEAVLASLNG